MITMMMIMMMTAFWNIASCSLVHVGQCFIALMMEAVRTSGKKYSSSRRPMFHRPDDGSNKYLWKNSLVQVGRRFIALIMEAVRASGKNSLVQVDRRFIALMMEAIRTCGKNSVVQVG
jgi:hypothetical protein